MTLAVASRNDYIGTGLVDTYAYGFKIFAASDLQVTVRDTDDVETELAFPADFDVTGVGTSEGGTVVLAAGALAEDFALTIRRVVELTQETDLRNQQGFFPEVIEDTFDYLTMIGQQQQDALNRVLLLPVTAPDTLLTTLPLPGAGGFIRWNLAGTELEAVAAGPADDTFTQSGIGAVARTWASKVGERVSLKDFGALGNGSTDDAVNINKAILAVFTAGGGTVYAPAGTYIVGSPIVLRSKVSIVGDGVAATIFKQKDAAAVTVMKTLTDVNTYNNTGDVSVGEYGIKLQDFSIDGNKANNAFGRGMECYWFKCEMRNVIINNTPQAGILEGWGAFGTPAPFEDMSNTYDNVTISSDDGQYGWYHNGPHDSKFNACIVCQGRGLANMFVGAYGSGAMFVNCHSWSELGVRQPTWSVIFEGTNCMWTNSTAEGGSTGQILIRGLSCSVMGGSQYNVNAAFAQIGIQIGDAANGFVGVTGYNIKTTTTNFSVATVAFDSDGGDGRIEIYGYNSVPSTLYTGTPAVDSVIDIYVTGFGGSLSQRPFPSVLGVGPAFSFGGADYMMNAIGDTTRQAAGFSHFFNSGFGGQIGILKSRAAGPGSHAIVHADDALGQFVFYADNGVDYESAAAAIVANVDGTPGVADMPGRLSFWTTADGTELLVERLRIDNKGNIRAGGGALATNAADGFLHVPTCAGVPTGVPTNYAGWAPIVIDTTDNRLYFYSGGAWRNAGP